MEVCIVTILPCPIGHVAGHGGGGRGAAWKRVDENVKSHHNFLFRLNLSGPGTEAATYLQLDAMTGFEDKHILCRRKTNQISGKQKGIVCVLYCCLPVFLIPFLAHGRIVGSYPL